MEAHIVSQCPFPNLIDPTTYANGMPYDELKRIRDDGPIHFMEDPVQGVPYWLITGRDEIDAISKNPKGFSSEARGATTTEYTEEEMAAGQRDLIINMDPPRQLRTRRIIRSVFTPAAVDSYEASFRAHAKRIVDAVSNRGECEFVEEVAAELPLLAILELCGIPPEDRKDFFVWTNTMIFHEDPDMAVSEQASQEASLHVIAYAMKLAEQHKTHPKDDLVGTLLKGTGGEGGMTMDEFCSFFLILIVAGNESTRTVTSHGWRLLMENPDQHQYLIDNPDKIPGACEEMLRYNTAFIQMRRTAMQDIEIAGQLIKKGDKVVMHYHTVNHDETVFGDDAMVFDVTRAERMPDLYNQHRSFGIGQHFCLGTHLARLELLIIMEEIIPRLLTPKLAGDIKYTSASMVNGISAMPITFAKEKAASI
jgi:cytochrome P450